MTPSVAIVDYGSGNLRSAEKAFQRMAGGGEVRVTSRAADLANASHIVLPGVGAFRDCREGLAAVDGMLAALEREVIEKKKPFLGICVGMQLLARTGREHGDTPGLGWVDGEVVEIMPDDPALKIPHMGWNALSFETGRHPVLDGIRPGDHVYFVHSFGFRPADQRHLLAATDYGGPVAAVVGRDNIIGTQFHPEKSQGVGLAFIAAFLGWRP